MIGGGYNTVAAAAPKRARLNFKPDGLELIPGLYPVEKVTVNGYEIIGEDIGAPVNISWSFDQKIGIDAGGYITPTTVGYSDIQLPACSGAPCVTLRSVDKLLDAHVRANLYPDTLGVGLRYQGGRGDLYSATIATGRSTQDFYVEHYYAYSGVYYTLAWEGVNLGAGWYDLVFSVVGSTLKASRNGGATFPIAATGTRISSPGYAVLSRCWNPNGCAMKHPLNIGPPLSPAPRVLAYFEVPVIGSGTREDPFRAAMPSDIRNGINVLALSQSSLIKSDPSGKPKEYRAIVRIFDQPDRDPSLAPIDKALEALRTMQGVRQLTREQAIAQAKLLDDKLTDLDLLPARELRKDPRAAAKEYKAWRVFNLGVREELIDDAIQERYADEDKGW